MVFSGNPTSVPSRRKREPVDTKCGARSRSIDTSPNGRPSSAPDTFTTRALRDSVTSVMSSVLATKCGPPSNGSMRSA